MLEELKRKAEVYSTHRGVTHYILFSRSGFTKAIWDVAKHDRNVIFVTLEEIFELVKE